MMKTQNTKLKVTDEHFSIEIEIPWDANIEEWKNVFVTVLTHKGFHRNTIDELFYDECKEDLNEKEIDRQSTSSAFNTPPQWWKDQIIGKDSCRPMGEKVW